MDETAYVALERYTKALVVALGYRDLYTRIHSERVLAICDAVAVRLGLDGAERGILTISAAFHDVGKIGIPDSILLKAGRLSDEETREMQQHSEVGARIVLATELDGAAEVARVIRHHHERFDGRGYPDGLSGGEIPLCSRIVGIADSYDAMAVTRSYHRARRHDEIMAILDEESGGKHDPALLEVFRSVIEDSPYKALDFEPDED